MTALSKCSITAIRRLNPFRMPIALLKYARQVSAIASCTFSITQTILRSLRQLLYSSRVSKYCLFRLEAFTFDDFFAI